MTRTTDYDRLKAANICPHCRLPVGDPDRVVCEDCVSREMARKRERERERRGEPSDPADAVIATGTDERTVDFNGLTFHVRRGQVRAFNISNAPKWADYRDAEWPGVEIQDFVQFVRQFVLPRVPGVRSA